MSVSLVGQDASSLVTREVVVLFLSLSESAAAGGCCKVKMKMKIMNNDLSLDSQVCLMCSNIGQISV